jgi:hypothetical protein
MTLRAVCQARCRTGGINLDPKSRVPMPIGVALHSWHISKHMLNCVCDVPAVANEIEAKPLQPG